MAELTVVELPDGYEDDTSNTPIDPGFVAGALTGDTFRCTGREILLAKNDDVSAQTISVTSQPESRTGRTGDITDASLPAGTIRCFQIFPRDGWESGGLVTVTVGDVDIKLAVLRAPVQAAG